MRHSFFYLILFVALIQLSYGAEPSTENLSPQCALALTATNLHFHIKPANPTLKVGYLCRQGMMLSVWAATEFVDLLGEKKIEDIQVTTSNLSGWDFPDDFDATLRIWGLDYAVIATPVFVKEYKATARKLRTKKGRSEIVALIRDYAKLNPDNAQKLEAFALELENEPTLTAKVPKVFYANDLSKSSSDKKVATALWKKISEAK